MIVVGSTASGKSTLVSLLVNHFGFDLYPSDHAEAPTDISTLITTNGNWKRNLVLEINSPMTPEILDMIDQVRKRPFSLLVSVEGI